MSWVSDRELSSALNGMLVLGPMHTRVRYKREAFSRMRTQQKGPSLVASGYRLRKTIGFAKVVASPIDDTPATRAGIKNGDTILAIEGKSVRGLSVHDVEDKLQGVPNRESALTVQRESSDRPIEISVYTRDHSYRPGKAANGA